MEYFISLPFLYQLAIGVGILAVARLVSAVFMMILKNSKVLTQRTETTLDDTVIQLLSRPVHFGFQLIGIVLALKYIAPDLRYQEYGYGDLSFILVVLWLAYLVNRLVIGILEWHENESQKDLGRKGGKTFAFLNTLISTLFYGIAIAFILNYLGVNISALLAGLGIAGVAVALALQNTLSGVFSAVYLAIDKPIRQGDYIRLEDGTEGFVQDISMRSTRIRTFSETLVIVPNSKLSNMVMTNFFLPGHQVVLKVPVGVAYDTDLDKAEEIALKTATEVLEAHSAMTKKEPFARYGTFGDSAIEMTIFMAVKKFDDQFVIKHEFIKLLSKNFAKAKIEIPYPQMDVHVQK